MRTGRLLALLASLAATANTAVQATTFDPLSLVDLLIGTQNGGNVFPGATLPYGLAKAVADVDGENTGGFATDGSNVTGFSALHDSGTGGNPSLGNFPLFPQICPNDTDINSCRYLIEDRRVAYRNDSVQARPGHFSVELETGIKADMTVSQHAALFRFQFPNSTSDDFHPSILLDETDLWQSRQNASISVDPKTGRMMGNGTFLPSFGAGSYVAYFCTDFFGGEVHDTGVWVNSRAGTEPKSIFLTRGLNAFFLEGGGWARFTPSAGQDSTITARMGLSFISAEKACANAEVEIPEPLADFDRLVEEAQAEWRKKLSVVSVKEGGATSNLLTSVYSGMYRMMISPQNYTGENPYWDDGQPYFDSYYW
jgi:putative alpha-1,2-mannosidase